MWQKSTFILNMLFYHSSLYQKDGASLCTVTIKVSWMSFIEDMTADICREVREDKLEGRLGKYGRGTNYGLLGLSAEICF